MFAFSLSGAKEQTIQTNFKPGNREQMAVKTLNERQKDPQSKPFVRIRPP